MLAEPHASGCPDGSRFAVAVTACWTAAQVRGGPIRGCKTGHATLPALLMLELFFLCDGTHFRIFCCAILLYGGSTIILLVLFHGWICLQSFTGTSTGKPPFAVVWSSTGFKGSNTADRCVLVDMICVVSHTSSLKHCDDSCQRYPLCSPSQGQSSSQSLDIALLF